MYNQSIVTNICKNIYYIAMGSYFFIKIVVAVVVVVDAVSIIIKIYHCKISASFGARK